MVSRFRKPTSGYPASPRLWRTSIFLALVLTLNPFSGGVTLHALEEEPPATKSIRGHVAGPHGKSQGGAKVFVRCLNNDTTTILVTNEKGVYAVYGLDPDLDYEVHAEFQRLSSKALAVSSMLNRADNVLNFKLSDREEGSQKDILKESIEIPGKDGVRFAGDWYPPPKLEGARFPAVLLLHGSGERRNVWDSFIGKRLQGRSMGVLNLDLAGRGDGSSDGESSPLTGDSHHTDALPELIEAAVKWLEARESIDPYRIAVVGTDLGADLAFLASGKFENVRSAVVISGNLANARRMAGETGDFQPHSILYMATQGDQSAVDSIAGFEQQTGFPRQSRVFEGSSYRGSQVLAEIPEASDLVVEWLRRTLR